MTTNNSGYYFCVFQLGHYLEESSCRLPEKQLEEWRARLIHELTEYNLIHSPIHVNLYNVSRPCNTKVFVYIELYSMWLLS